jgi:hypothetical protein
MNHVCQEIAVYSRACERLLSKEAPLTDDERSLLEYYLNELSREFLSDKPTVRLRYRESAVVEPNSHA